MSQRAVVGRYDKYAGKPLWVVREHGTRVECIALVDWIVPMILEGLTDYWAGDCAPDVTPETSTLATLRGLP